MVTASHHQEHPVVKILVLAASLAWPAAVQAQNSWYVDDDGSAQGGCTSWEDACPDLQIALGLAQAGDEIRVAQGVYKPTEQDGDRAATFELIDGVALRGGYLGLSAGKGQDPNDRDIDLYETILSGDLDGDDGPDFENNEENSFHVVTGDNTDDSAVIDGFTITSGHAEVFGDNHGAGMHNLFGSPTVMNCKFTLNAARGDLSRGGAIYNRGSVDNHTAPTITNCAFNGNLVESVGAATTNGRGGDIVTDLDGNPRFIDGDNDGDIDVDMGAYEFQGGVSCPADLDGDGAVGASDLALLLGNWGPCAGCPADLDGDGAVSAFDLALLLGAWGLCPD